MFKTTFKGYVPKLKLKGAEATIVEGKAIESKGGSIRYTLRGEYEGHKTFPKTVSKADFENVYGFDAKEAEAVIITGKEGKDEGVQLHLVGVRDDRDFTPEKIVPIKTMNEYGHKKLDKEIMGGHATKSNHAETVVGSPSPASVEPSAPSETPFPQEPSNENFSAECGDGGQNPCKECGGHPCPRCNAPHPSSHDSIETKDGDVCLPCATDAETRENYFWNDLLGGYMTREEMLEQYPERKDEIDNSRNPEMREDYQPYQESYQPKEIDIEEIERLGMEKDEREIKKLMDEKGLTYEEARQMKMDNAIDQIPHWESNEVKEAFGFGKDEEEEPEEEKPKEQEFTVVLQEGDKLELTDIEEDDEPKEEDNDSNEENDEKDAEDFDFVGWIPEAENPDNCFICGKSNQGFEGNDNVCTTCDESWEYDEGGEEGEGYYLKETKRAVTAKVTRPVKEEEEETEDGEGLSTLAKVGLGLSALAVGAAVLGAEDEPFHFHTDTNYEAIYGADTYVHCSKCEDKIDNDDTWFIQKLDGSSETLCDFCIDNDDGWYLPCNSCGERFHEDDMELVYDEGGKQNSIDIILEYAVCKNCEKDEKGADTDLTPTNQMNNSIGQVVPVTNPMELPTNLIEVEAGGGPEGQITPDVFSASRFNRPDGSYEVKEIGIGSRTYMEYTCPKCGSKHPEGHLKREEAVHYFCPDCDYEYGDYSAENFSAEGYDDPSERMNAEMGECRDCGEKFTADKLKPHPELWDVAGHQVRLCLTCLEDPHYSGIRHHAFQEMTDEDGWLKLYDEYIESYSMSKRHLLMNLEQFKKKFMKSNMDEPMALSIREQYEAEEGIKVADCLGCSHQYPLEDMNKYGLCEECQYPTGSEEESFNAESKNVKGMVVATAIGIALAVVLGKDKLGKLFERFDL